MGVNTSKIIGWGHKKKGVPGGRASGLARSGERRKTRGGAKGETQKNEDLAWRETKQGRRGGGGGGKRRGKE